MAGTITTTVTKSGALSKYKMDWLSDASGDVDVDAIPMIQGEIQSVHYFPDAGGTQPSDNYDLTMADSFGVDILTGTGANLSQTTDTYAVPALSTYFKVVIEAGSYDLVVANAGNAKGGIVEVVIRQM
jgi:hypothetical protein|tara:strand:- start:802 stop:1185 length:384 start_codon:yes stop_codon:yes gene_type:complete